MRPFLLALSLVTLAACTTSQQTAVEAPSAPPPPAVAAPAADAPPAPPPAAARPLPHPLTLPAEFQAAVERGTRTLTGMPGPDYWTQTSAYTVDATLDPDARTMQVATTIRYTNRSPDTLQTLHVELAQNLHAPGALRGEDVEVTGGFVVDAVSVVGAGGDGGPLTAMEGRFQRGQYGTAATQLVLAPTSPILPGETVTVRVSGGFAIPQAGASGRMGYSRDDLFFLAYWFPHMAVYDDVEGWYTDPFRGRAEFYYGYGDYDVTLRVPEGWLVMATGELQNADEVLAPEVLERMREAHTSDEPVMIATPDTDATAEAGADGLLTWRFVAEDVRDFAFNASRDGYWEGARTSVGDRDGDGAEDFAAINTFWRPEAPLWVDVTRFQQHAIAWMSDYTGLPYPYPHMTAVEGADIIGGGMEFPMMTLMGDYESRGSEALYNVTAHELAHMWIPMVVGTNERRHSWIDEGSTSFLENQARFDFFPAGGNHNRGDLQGYLAVARAGLEGEMMRWSDFHYNGAAFGTASYSKPASLLVALRAVLGEATFLEGYRAFIDAWAYKHPTPYDFFNAFEAAAGEDLDWFWRSWYFETWTLDQAIVGVEQAGGQATITIEDRGLVPMPVPLAITLEGGDVIRREVPVYTWLEGATEAAFELETDRPVTRVEIDPEGAFPDIDRENNVWVR